MSHRTRASKPARQMTALASAVALALGTLSLAGCGNDDDVPPVEEERPVTEEQTSPMQDTTADPGIDQTDTAAGDGSAEPITGAEESPEGMGDVTPEQDPLPEAEQEPIPDEDELEGQQDTMDQGQVDDPLVEEEEEQGGN
ncbi:hypothetical protein [Billgrantia desiderata]|uniref:Uncharacterized protein n=2 Tax=Billgrantia desiderata TaxID=52021 RepID=A0ABS9BAR5_9GAMM|nr:hypothetical protein [Halomonas desiderata]MCE8012968.1 hypothetical protein [Halomonas desiderata]MCE8028485.1 hypothetical protein [Halomonas desiderata]MCE8044648.1 hypothetical protein [Halomonas desiderata]MCE8049222.1 hypothetical protein [Halomonas desiderata]NIC38376.1 hypothetical protein [Halomonas desiderata]